MADVPPPSLPGSMTVPPMAGWEDILTVLVALLVTVAVTFVLTGTARDDVARRSEWQAYLEARSTRRVRGDRIGSPTGSGAENAVSRTGGIVPGARPDERFR